MKRYPCEQCDYVARFARSLKKHVEAKHEGKGTKTFIFSYCLTRYLGLSINGDFMNKDLTPKEEENNENPYWVGNFLSNFRPFVRNQFI